MRVAALYDIHGNLPALEAVLEQVRELGVTEVVVGGDVVPGPMPVECIARLRGLDLPTHFIRGNGDREVVAYRDGIESTAVPERFRGIMRWNAQQLDAHDVALLRTWPATLRLDVPGLGVVLFCHATPQSDTEIFTRISPERRLAPFFEGLGANLVICGHTHMQFDRRVGDVRIVNAGSVGMPFGAPGACWLLLGPGVTLQRTDYDRETAADRVRRTQYPLAGEFAERSVLKPPSEQEMLDVYARADAS